MSDLLIELGCEELPADSVLPMAEHLGAALQKVLQDAGLCQSEPVIYATPRRIAARFDTVSEKQADQTVERKGPSKAAAFDDNGEPSKALGGFLKSAGVAVEDISYVDTPKGEWVVVQQLKAGETLEAVLASALPGLIKTMPMPKRMRWSDHAHEFLRPVVWFVALHGDRVLPLELLGLSAGKHTHGHRFHSPGEIAIDSVQGYADTLKQHNVIADYAERKQLIKSQVDALAKQMQGKAVADEALLDEVTALVEWPVAVAGRFEERFLEIPKEALIQTMQENQRYFALLDDASNLLPAFITIANIESKKVDSVIDGNERVIRPRFADTMFFWEQDKKRKLADIRPELDSLLFQEKLGSVGDKVDRIKILSSWLAETFNESVSDSMLAADLCKCDLNTEIVRELAKMQGIAGRYYAERDGHSPAVCEAMEAHYFPKQSGGVLPEGGVAQVVSLADKTDTLVGIYGLGMKPTGAKDPFGLRRAALGIVRIIIEKQRDINLADLLNQSIQSYGDRLPADLDVQTLIDYVLERMRGYALEQGYSADVIDAVLAKSLYNPLDIDARLRAIKAFRNSAAAASLSAASKRSGNMLKKVEEALPETVSEALLVEPAEKALYATLQQLSPQIEAQMLKRNYQEAMETTAGMRESVDAFFDDVMVLTDDIPTRQNRLALLTQLNALCSGTAELSRLQPAES